MKPFFDYSEGNFGMEISENLLMDFDGDFTQRMRKGLAMDFDSGEIHIVSLDKSDDGE